MSRAPFSKINDTIIDIKRLRTDINNMAVAHDMSATALLTSKRLTSGYYAEFSNAYAAKDLGYASKKSIPADIKKEYRDRGLGCTSRVYFEYFCDKLNLNMDNYICTVHINTSAEEDFSEPVNVTEVNIGEIVSSIDELKKSISDLGRIQLQSMEYLKQLVDMWSK